jgi:UDP-glucose 4-epimerase
MSVSHAVITGVAGFVGSHLAQTLLSMNVTVIGLDNLERGSRHRITTLQTAPHFTFIKGDIRDETILDNALSDETVVFHEAALIDVNESLTYPDRYYQTNVGGFLTVLEACRRHDVPRLIFASSCAVYGQQAPGPIREPTAPAPVTPYASTKLEGERLCQTYAEHYGLSTMALRYFNIYGPGQTSAYGSVMTMFLQQAQQQHSLTIYGDGLQTRDFIHITDIVAANILASQAKHLPYAVINIGTGIATTIKDLAIMINAITDNPNRTIHHALARAGDIRFSQADITQAQLHLNFHPKVTLKSGVLRLLEQAS